MSLAPAFHLEKRQAFGSRGRQTTVTVNCFQVTKAPDGMIQHYDVAWSGNPADKRVLMDWLLRHPSQAILGQAGKMAVFDGKANLFVHTKEKKNKATFTIDERQARKLPPLPPKPAGSKASRPLTVTLTWANEVNAYELIAHVNGQAAGSDGINQVNQAVNLLIKHEPSAAFPVTRTSFYPTPNKRGEPVLCSAGLELWRGYFASLRPSIGKSILNFDTVTGLFRKSGNLVDILLRIVGQNDPRRLYDEKMPPKLQVWRNRFLKGLTVELGHTGEKKRYKIRGISRSSASEYTFEVEPGKKETIERHFAKKYNIKLKAPYLPVIQVTATSYVPMEVASVVVGGTFFGKLSPRMDADLVGEMMKSAFTTLKPQQRVEAIKEGLKYLRLRTPVFQHWNFDIDTNPMNVKARVLPPPVLSYLDARTNKPSTVTPNDGQWDARGKKGSRVAPRLDKWLVVVFAVRTSSILSSICGTDTSFHISNDEGDGRAKGSVAKGAILQAVTDYVKAASQYGVNISNRQPFIYFAGGHPPNVEQAVIAATKAAGFSPAKPHQFILTFSDKTNSNIYNAVKTLCDLKMGLPCENLSLQKALGAKPSYWSNVAPKINFKLGGVNQTIDGDPPGFKQFPTIVFGADVTHPAGFSMAASIAAIIGSHDLRAAEYSAEIRLQLARQEIITDLESASLALMMKFSRMTKQKPARVIFFRDGVSEGQFDQVCNEEIPALKRAMAQIPGTKPTLTYIICGKRHHVRLFPNGPQDADRSGNVKAGMCVDSDITLPYGQDYYLVSHGGLLGTSRPCHYSVLVDEAKMGPDALQALCFYMAHLYPRSTRSVSIPTPAYLAHHAATRARIHLGPDPDEDNVSSVGEKKKTRDEIEEYKQEKLQQALGRFRTVTGPLADTMYYM